MSKFNLLLLFTFSILCFNVFPGKTQIIECSNGKLRVENFVSDSAFTYNSRYVRYGAVSNIKKSKFPIEIRLFTYSMSSDIIDVKIIQATKDSIYIRTQRIWVAPPSGISNYKKIFETKTFSVNVANRPMIKQSNNYIDSFVALNNLEFFSIQGVTDTKDFALDKSSTIMDGISSHWIEMKIGSNFRNINYIFNPRLIDPDQTRAQQMQKIVNLIRANLNTKAK